MLLNKPKFRFHVIGLPHTATNKNQYLHCAYTQKVLNFCKMMHNNGHYVMHYGGEGSEVECDEHVTIMTTAKRNQWFKSNWEKGEFPDMQFDKTKPYWMWANANATMEIGKRIRPHDFICLISSTQAPIAQAFPNNISVEYGIGYEGTIMPFLCFESEAWRHHVYGLNKRKDGNWYDRVIYNYYDPLDFPLGSGDGDYYLFLGRIILRKNPHVAADICKRIGENLIIAGQGITSIEPGKLCSREVTIVGDHVHYVGVVDVKKRAELLGKAKALFILTQYIAPFEGVHAEAGLCLPHGQFVSTGNSQLQIENIHVGDIVQGQSGNVIVEKTFGRLYDGSIINIKALGMLPIKATPEHPILIAHMERIYSKENVINKKLAYVRTITGLSWENSANVKPGDFLVFKKEKRIHDIEVIDVSKYCFRDTANTKNKQKSIPINVDTLWLFGLYVAEGGGSSGGRLDLGKNDKERALAERASEIIKTNLPYTPVIVKTKQDCYRVRFGGSIFSRFLKHEFGQHCLVKTIPQWIIDLPLHKLKAFLDGYIAGDGCILPADGSLCLSTSSEILALQLQRAFSKFGILIPISIGNCEGITEIRGGSCYRNKRYLLRSKTNNIFNNSNANKRPCHIYLEDSDNFYVRVMKVSTEQYVGAVSNLKTADGTYCVSNMIVHNCGCPVITTDWGVFPETVEQGITGFRVRTIGEAMWAAKNVNKLDRAKIREKALAKFSLDAIAPQYEEWFDRLYGLYIPGKDFYDEGPGRFIND